MNTGKRFYDALVSVADKLTPLWGLLPGKKGKFFRGRRHWKKQLQQAGISPGGIWIHAASAGEYEQALPLMESLKKRFPGRPVILTFFSPSGYEFLKDKTPADYVCYLPLDTRKNAAYFIDRIKPALALFIKYEFWPNFLKTLKEKSIPVFLVSGVFRENQSVLKQNFLKDALYNFSGFFVQDEKSAALLRGEGLNNVMVTGDTRFDRVKTLPGTRIDFPVIKDFKAGRKLLVAGSTWPEDEDLLVDFIEDPRARDWKLLIVPHEPTPDHIKQLLKKIRSKAALYSRYAQKDKDARILIGDVMGLLKYVYRYADTAYVGGGFGKGIHNILEAAVYSVPVLFGPNYKKFNEAVNLLQQGGAFVITSSKELKDLMFITLHDENIKKAGKIAGKFVNDRTGAVEKITEVLEKYIN